MNIRCGKMNNKSTTTAQRQKRVAERDGRTQLTVAVAEYFAVVSERTHTQRRHIVFEKVAKCLFVENAVLKGVLIRRIHTINKITFYNSVYVSYSVHDAFVLGYSPPFNLILLKPFVNKLFKIYFCATATKLFCSQALMSLFFQFWFIIWLIISMSIIFLSNELNHSMALIYPVNCHKHTMKMVILAFN